MAYHLFFSYEVADGKISQIILQKIAHELDSLQTKKGKQKSVLQIYQKMSRSQDDLDDILDEMLVVFEKRVSESVSSSDLLKVLENVGLSYLTPKMENVTDNDQNKDDSKTTKENKEASADTQTDENIERRLASLREPFFTASDRPEESEQTELTVQPRFAPLKQECSLPDSPSDDMDFD